MKTLFVIVCLYLQKRLSQVTDSQKEKPRGRGWDGRGGRSGQAKAGGRRRRLPTPAPPRRGTAEGVRAVDGVDGRRMGVVIGNHGQVCNTLPLGPRIETLSGVATRSW